MIVSRWAPILLCMTLMGLAAGCTQGPGGNCIGEAAESGCSTEAEVTGSPPTMATGRRLTSSAAFSPRDSMAAVEFNGLLWILGGFTPDRSNEVWHSQDGVTWKQAPAPPWSPRNLAGAAVLNGRLLLIGGYGHDGDQVRLLDDIYSTRDGESWELVDQHAPWGPRAAFGLAVHKEYLYILGGNGPQGPCNDVWRTADGLTWELISSAAPWAPRGMLASVSFNDRLWVIGGGDYDETYVYNVKRNYNDVWSSPDGARWTLETHRAAFSPRRFHSAFVDQNAIFISAGFELDQRIFKDPYSGLRKADLELRESEFYSAARGRAFGNLNDVWASRDGRSWHKVSVADPFSPRHAVPALGASGSVLFIGGFGEELYNDVWSLRFH